MLSLYLFLSHVYIFQILSEPSPPKHTHSFDFILADGTRVKANGYRSLLHTLNCLLLQLHQVLQKCSKERASRFYLPGDDLSSITALCRALEVRHYHHQLIGFLFYTSVVTFNKRDLIYTNQCFIKKLGKN